MLYWDEEYSKKMISLKIDVATRLGKSILGINVQYIKNSEIVINTIGMVQLKRKHTAHYLKEKILKCLDEFGIALTQVYSTTTDNGANMLKASKFIQHELDLQNEEPENENFELVHRRLNSVLAVVRCAAHTLQLAVLDSFKEIKEKLEDCRKIVKLLRTKIRSGNFVDVALIPLDTATRWNSTFEMIQSLLNMRDQIIGNEIELSYEEEIDWNFIAKFVESFKPLAECTKQLQAEQYVIGDFYRDWLLCEAKLKKLSDNPFAVKVLQSMSVRKEKLLENVAFVSGIYFDPRFNFLDSPFINEDQKKIAVAHILRTNATLVSLIGEGNTNSETSLQNNVSNSTDDPYSILEEELSNLSSCGLLSQNNGDIRQKIDALQYGQRMSFATNVLDYWKNQPKNRKIWLT